MSLTSTCYYDMHEHVGDFFFGGGGGRNIRYY